MQDTLPPVGAEAQNRLPFKVSARAARLIGRENVATSQGAMTELVKNSYDADALACVILFVRKHKGIPEKLSVDDFEEIKLRAPVSVDCYKKTDGTYSLLGELSESTLKKLNSELDNVIELWIIDNGNGMSANTIENRWMVIGTDAKEQGEVSTGGRVFTGAKGIGRFALDRLGRQCELYSAEEGGDEIVHWYVDWGEFEGPGKIIDDVTALLEKEKRSLKKLYSELHLSSLLPKEIEGSNDVPVPVAFAKGTALRISLLNDSWDQRDSKRLRSTLEALLPPKDQRDFAIYVYDHRDPANNGWIDNLLPDQFDYRLKATVRSDGLVEIKIDRQEIDEKKINPEVFSLPAMQVPNFQPADFERGSISYEKSLDEIVGKSQIESKDYLAIGPFEFTLYFLKLQNPSKNNLEKYPQKTFDVNKRKRWLAASGGIRLYRDQFRVRPYGEPNTQGSDWLLLGQRVAQNPAQASRLGWRVPPQQVAGTIHISKALNPLLADQSNREGIMNERAFSAFRAIVIGLIKEFENDRSYIYQQFDLAYKKSHPDEEDFEKGKRKAEKILRDRAQKTASGPASEGEGQPSGGEKRNTSEAENDAEDVAKALHVSVQRNNELEDELQVLRGMATLGTVLVSFTHELKQIQANMEKRHARLKNAILRVADNGKLGAVESEDVRLSPFDVLDRIEREDAKVSRWVDFALSSVSQNKRRRRTVSLSRYFDSLKNYWDQYLEDRNIVLKIDSDDFKGAHILAHEIDLDSVFYNLVVNSVEAVTQPAESLERAIWIENAGVSEDTISIVYRDNGPGIPAKFNIAEDIFLFGVSAKAGANEEEASGTGIGMWLVKSIVDDFNGDITIRSKMGEPNFEILIQLPLSKA